MKQPTKKTTRRRLFKLAAAGLLTGVSSVIVSRTTVWADSGKGDNGGGGGGNDDGDGGSYKKKRL